MVRDQGESGGDDLPLRVLLVEDNDADAELVLMLRNELPFAEVTVVSSLAGALLALEREFDAVLADLSEPAADGFGVVAAIQDACPETAVVVVNGPAELALAMEAIGAGVGDYLIKDTYDAAGLATAVLNAVRRVRSGEQTRRDQQLASGLLETMESPTCAVTADGTIAVVNAPWLAFAIANGGGLGACAVGVNYLAVCDASTDEWSDEAAEVADGLRAVLAGRIARFELDYPCHTPTHERWFSVRVLPRPTGGGAVVTHRDITALKLSQRALSRQGLHDTLTDLPNRALLTDRLEQALAEGARAGHLVAVAFLNLDQFERINASLGHAAGDVVLVEVAERLALRLGEGDTLARFAGDEFVAVWPNLESVEQASKLSERLAQTFEAPFPVGGSEVLVSASIGVCVAQPDQEVDEMLLAAVSAMREAKRRGPGQVRVFTPELREQAVPMMRTEMGLRAAMYNDELVMHYQPVVDLTRGTVVGVEALIRWQHPTDGLIGPDQFIPVAEASGLIVSLGAWVLEQAATQAVRWQADGLVLDMAVNLSTRQVAHRDLVPTLERVLHETGVDPHHLVLEVTESAVMEDAEAAATVLRHITEMGVSLAIDDFGTGYSSLVYLKRYPIRALKVDRSFTAGMGIYAEDDAIVASVIGLAKAVGGSCIAEGIETEEQYAALRSLRCGFGQGWLFGKAVPAHELPELIAQCEEKLAALEQAFPQDDEHRGQTADQRDQVGDERDQVGDERDQVGDERDQVGDRRDLAADRRDQVGDDRDQVGDRRDQAGDQRDQAGDDRDQVGDQRDLAADERDQAGDQRDQVGDDRDQVGDQRDQAGDQRDQVADQRDQVADERDRAADERDRAADHREAGVGADVTTETFSRSALARREAASNRTRASQDRQEGADERTLAELDRNTALARRDSAPVRTRASQDRQHGASERTRAELDRHAALSDRGAGAGERTQAELDRHTALSDRGAGAGERTQAELDRHTALSDRGAGASERTQAELDRHTALNDREASAREGDVFFDPLSGVYFPTAGLVQLEREMARARLTGLALVLALIDVDRLKVPHGPGGHAAGDRMLLGVAKALGASVRSYDLLHRTGGDAFVWALSGLDMASVTKRLALVNAALAKAPEPGLVRFGLAELRPGDLPEDVVARANAALQMTTG